MIPEERSPSRRRRRSRTHRHGVLFYKVRGSDTLRYCLEVPLHDSSARENGGLAMFSVGPTLRPTQPSPADTATRSRIPYPSPLGLGCRHRPVHVAVPLFDTELVAPRNARLTIIALLASVTYSPSLSTHPRRKMSGNLPHDRPFRQNARLLPPLLLAAVVRPAPGEPIDHDDDDDDEVDGRDVVHI